MENASDSCAHQQYDDRCEPWEGLREAYQDRGRFLLGVSLHHWISATCKTELCLNPTHLVARAPLPLDYLPNICVYCGLLAGTIDHLLPRTWTGDSLRRRVLCVPACQQCNSILGDRYIPSISGRRETVHAALYRKYKSRLREAEDIDQWISEIGPNLRSAIEKQREFAQTVKSRLAWPGTEHYDIGACTRAGFDDPYAAGLISDVTPVDYDIEIVKATKRARLGSWPSMVKPDPSVPCPRDCRCIDCAKLSPNDRRRRQLVLINGVPVHPDPLRGHGVASTYQSHGCRCEPCTQAFEAREAASKARRIQGVWIPDPRRPWQGVLNLWANGLPWPRDYTPKGRAK